MIHDAGVKTIAMGGRPNANPIQGMGGVKGAQSFGWGDVYNLAQMALPRANAEQAAILNTFSPLPILRASTTSINLRDLIIPSELNEQEPAQFVAEDADCRLYWTAPMITDVTKVWEAAADAAWGDGKCVSGSLQKRGGAEGFEKKRVRNTEGEKTERVSEEKNRRDVTAEKDAMWSARHGRKVVS